MDLLQIIKILAKGKIVQNWVHYFGCSRNFTAFHINCLLLSHNCAALHRCFVQFVFCFSFHCLSWTSRSEAHRLPGSLIGRQAHFLSQKQDALFSSISHTPSQLMAYPGGISLIDSKHLICTGTGTGSGTIWTRFPFPLALVQDLEWFHQSNLSLLRICTTAAEIWFCLLS